MKEIEVKILEVIPKKIKQSLIRNKAKLIMARNKQINYFYENEDTKDGKATVRIRKDNLGFTLTIKSRLKVISDHKVMDEYEVKIDDGERLRKGLELIGFKQIGQGELYREDWKLFDCLVSIGEFPRIPPYVEIEGSKKNILRVAKILGYSEKDFVGDHLLKVYNIKDKFLRFKK